MSEESKQKDGDGAAVDKYNVEAAEILASEAQRLPISEAAPIYEQLISTFPTAGKYWKLYVEAYMAANNDDAAKHLFSRCLLSCLQISLWHCYIRFIRKVNERKGVDGLEEAKQAYDFMLSYVGTDIGSGPLWMEYIAFLKSRMATSPQEESQRMTTVRKVYQKAIVTPTHQVEQLWKDYENFENSVSRQLAKGLISEYQPKFNSARAVYRERKKYVDELDWNVLAVPPSGSSKEEKQYMAWKNFLAFEKGNPQRIDSSSANKRIAFTFEQSLLYLYHYPDIWYDYATWHVRSGSIDSAVKVYQRAIKALPDSESLRYAYAELEESRGGIQMAKNIYEGLLAKNPSSTALAQIQFIRFLRRNEGMEAARKNFIDARKLENCTYHVYVAYALIAFCVDKDPKFAHSVFETGLKRFMHEPGYILDYADFLCRVNDDRNVRALFERALSSLPPDESIEVWKRFVQFEQTYGDLASMLKVEQRKKEALSRTCDDTPLEGSLHDVVARYSFMDLWPCTSKELDHLARQEWLASNIYKKVEKPKTQFQVDTSEKGPVLGSSSVSARVIYPDTSKMVIYDPRVQGTNASIQMPDDIMKVLPPALASFVANLPAVEGPSPDVNIVISILLQSNIPIGPGSKPTSSAPQFSRIPGPSTSDLSGSSKTHPHQNGALRKGQLGKRKESKDDDTTTVQSRPLPADVFKLRHMRKSRGISSASQTGSAASGGSAFSGELSGSTG